MNKSYFAIGAVVILLITLLIYKSQKGGNNKESLGTSTSNTSVTPILTPTPTQVDTASPSATIDKMDNQGNVLVKEDLVVGTGAEATTGKSVSVNYKGTFVSGEEFDSSYKRGVPFEFVLGAGRVIQGWDQGVVGMKVGGKRKLTVPPSLGYGPNDYGPIPGNSTLIFEVELLEVN